MIELSLVIDNSLVYQGCESTDSGVGDRIKCVAGRAAPGHNTGQGPDSILLAHKGSTRVTHAGRDARGPGTDHGGLNSGSPVFLAISVAHDWKTCLLELSREGFCGCIDVSPSGGGTYLSFNEDIIGGRKTHWRHPGVEGDGSGQLDQGEVIDVGLGVVLGV